MCKKVSRVEKGDKEDEIAIGRRGKKATLPPWPLLWRVGGWISTLRCCSSGSALHGSLDCLKRGLEVAEAEKGYGMDAFRNLFTVGLFQASDRKSSVAPSLSCAAVATTPIWWEQQCFLHQFEGLTLLKIRCIWPWRNCNERSLWMTVNKTALLFLSECPRPVSGRSVFWHLVVCALCFPCRSHLPRVLLCIHECYLGSVSVVHKALCVQGLQEAR